MDKKQNNWQRIESVIQWANMSANYFARYIGLAHGENLYQIKRGNNGISLNLAQRIVEHFPQIDKLWLLTGEGSMFADETLRGAGIPYYNAEAGSVLRDLERRRPDEQLFCPMVTCCDLALNGGEVVIPGSGKIQTVLFLRKIDTEWMIPGKEYMIVGAKIVTLRKVCFDGRDDLLHLAAEHPESDEEIVIPRQSVEAAYMVTAKLMINK